MTSPACVRCGGQGVLTATHFSCVRRCVLGIRVKLVGAFVKPPLDGLRSAFFLDPHWSPTGGDLKSHCGGGGDDDDDDSIFYCDLRLAASYNGTSDTRNGMVIILLLFLLLLSRYQRVPSGRMLVYYLIIILTQIFSIHYIRGRNVIQYCVSREFVMN